MRNNLKESSRPPELLVLEPEINRLVLCSLQSELIRIPTRTQTRIGVLFDKSANPDFIILLSCRKTKKTNRKKKDFLIERVHSF